MSCKTKGDMLKQYLVEAALHMRTTISLIVIAVGLMSTSVCNAQRVDPKQALQGILTGEESRDQLIIRGYQRGYQFGVEDAKRDAQRECKAQLDKLTAQCKQQK